MDQQPIRRTALRAGLPVIAAAASRAAARALAVVALASALAAGFPPSARAQTPVPAPNPALPTEKPSQKNPFPRGTGDNLNRGRAHDDKYWGVTDGNRFYVAPDYAAGSATSRGFQEGFQVPFARVSNRLEMDGFQFPRLAGTTLARQPIFVDNENTGAPVAAPLPVPGTFIPGITWQAGVVNAPSTNFQGNGYQRTPAVERAAGSIDDIPATQRANSVVTWYPSVPGAPGVLQRYQIRVLIPTPAETTVTPQELRISDARYVIYYHVRVGAAVETRRRIVTLSQETEGYRTVVDNNGRPLLFPMFSEASYGTLIPDTPAARARLELDNTTENDTTSGGEQRYVIADDAEFNTVSETIKATPVVTPAHGGRKLRAADNAAFVLGTGPLYQPPGETSLQRRDNTLVTEDFLAVGGNVAYINDSFSFINNPRDPDTIYTDTTSNFYQAFEPWNPSTLFRGPSALIENDPGTGPVPSRTTIRNTNYARHPVPFFSHMQAIVARTEYVNDPNDPQGVTTREVGAVYGLDWLTGTPIWRFPDRTHLPADFEDQYGNPVAGRGLRNPNTAVETRIVNGVPTEVAVPTLPGIGAYDKNGNGVIEDEEVYIVGQGINPDGGISAAPTLVARMQVRGVMDVPVHSPTWNYFNDLPGAVAGGNSNSVNLTSIRGIAPAAAGRYATTDATGAILPVEAGVVFIAANNGVLYAIDPYGNNDNDYYQDPALPGEFGHVRPGTTNVFWSFSTTVRPRRSTETTEAYNRYLKGQVPVTESFAGSAPAVSFYKEQADVNPDNTVNQPATLDLTEPRLFVGNQNGVLYAMDARPDAQVDVVGGVPSLNRFPFRKGVQPSPTGAVLSPQDRYRTDLKWWFETEGSINSAPAVSNYRHYSDNPAAPQNDAVTLAGNPTPSYILSKGVYVTTLEGRVYCIDWTGPVTKSLGLVDGHVQTVLWNGTTGNTADEQVDAFTAEQLNDNFRFHNGSAARPLAQGDGTEGTIRPRWAFPQRYRDINAGPPDNSVLAPVQPPDNSRVFAGTRLAEPRTLAPIYGAPSLMDFVYDPDGPAGAAAPEMRRYVVVAANDPNGSDPEVSGRLYLLDQAGDRRDFTTNPTVAAGTPNTVVSHPLDQYSPTNYVFGKAAPVWTYRSEYKRLDPATGNEVDVQQRNSPDDDPLGTTDGNLSLSPTRRLLPTVFAGTTSGRLFAVDLDPATGFFLRWRADEATTRQFAVLPTLTGGLPAGYIPGQISDADRLNPMNPAITAAGLADRRILARTIQLRDLSSVDGGMVITGGPLQNRNSGVTADTVPTVPPRPANDLPILTATLLTLTEPVVQPYFTAPFPPPAPTFALLPSFEQFGRLVNQDIDDPVATTVGAFNAFTNAGFAQTEPAVDPDTNRAYQYPTLWVTTDGGAMHQVNTNLEGESPDPTPTSNGTATMGWALSTDELRFNEEMTHFVSVGGPGGPGVGPVVVTNAYFAAMDPSYRNPVQKILVDDPSATNYQAYPPGEPVDEDPLGGDDVLDPRQHFKARSLSPGNAENQDPDGVATTPDGIPATKADAHTGRTGFPLDLSGLFYDKRYAAEPGLGGENNNDDGIVRLPAYSQIGAALPAGQELVLPAGNRGVNLADPVPTNATAAIFDINPAATDAIWVFTGGSDGVFYGYTPNLLGRGSGLAGGFFYNQGQFGSRTEGDPKFDLISGAFAAQIQAELNGGNLTQGTLDTLHQRTQSLARGAGRPFFEWGETVYVVAYDLPWRPPVPAGGTPEFPDAFSITVRQRNGQGTALRRTVRFPRDAQNRVILYPNQSNNPTWFSTPFALLDNGDPTDNPFGPNAGAYTDAVKDPLNLDNTPLTLVLIPLEITASNGTPGGILEVSSGETTRRTSTFRNGRRTGSFPALAGGPTDSRILENLPVYYTVANPLALQAFLSNTNDGGPANPNPGANGVTVNAIGPFESSAAIGGVKNRVIDSNIAAGTDDPDRAGREYSQALSNGNTITRYVYDAYARDGAGNILPNVRNFRFGQRATLANGQDDPLYYVPVATSAAYVDHGTTKSTDLANNRRNLRIVNRSLLNVLPQVRVQIDGDLIWRTWPGQRPNLDPTDNGAAPGGANPRFTPTGAGGNYAMRPDGIVNILPWEQPVLDALPWKGNRRTAAVTGAITAVGNSSQDYPDIAARPLTGGESQDAVKVTGPGGDLVRGPGSIVASVGGGQNSTVTSPLIREPFADASTAEMQQYGVAVSISVPKYQPANLVAMHSLTSTYVTPSIVDDPTSNFATGPIQLPRDTSATPRVLREQTGAGAFSGNAVVAPYGYTTKMKVYVDADGDGVWDQNEAYREFETWMGVPVDIQLRQKDGTIGLTGKTGGALQQGFAIQNGLLGYGNVLAPLPPSATFGFIPPPLPNLPGGGNGYDEFFKTFSVVSESNVNLWNVRASQRISPNTSGNPYFYYGMISDTVDPRYGVLAAAADPVAFNGSGLMPQVVTSLDRIFDGAWDTLSAATPQLNVPVDSTGTTRYQRFYQGFGGRHTLHKPRPNSSSGSVLSLPDAPPAQLPGTGPGAGVPFVPQPTRIGVAVPLGTPSGKYSSRIGTPPFTLFNSPFQIFEDHDTNNPYVNRPVNTGGGSITLAAAGPMYSGQGLLHPGSNPILPQSGEAILRPREVFVGAGRPNATEYLPATPNLEMVLEVGEVGLTGQVADQGIDGGGSLTPSIVTGTLTGIDPFPLFNATSLRPFSSLTPAAFRSAATGDLHVYFSSTQSATGVRGGQPAPNTPVSLFRSSLDWDPRQGTWVAANPGTPVSAVSLLASQARWFTPPVEVAGVAANQGNRSPFVLYDPVLQDPGAGGANAAATLYWVRTLPVPGGEPVNQVVYAPIDPATGQPGAPVGLLADASFDPTLRRYGPRAAYVPNGTAFVVFFGGPAGRTSLYYAAQDTDGAGGVTTRAQRERILTVPEALSVTQEPSAVTRFFPPTPDEPAIPGRTDYVVDVYYTGISRSNQNADIYVSRYRVAGSGPGARLIPIDLAPQDGEELVAPGRDSLYRARHIGWFRRLTDDPATPINDVTLLPQIFINGQPINPAQQTRWQFDNATQLLSQAFVNPITNREAVVYVDTSAGEVRFRGPGAPTPGGNVRVFASYVPLAYRVAFGPGSDTAPIAVMDRRPVLSTVNEGGAFERVLSRPANFDNSNGQGIDRQWVFWQRAATGGQAQSLFYTTRRVGVNLKALGTVPANRTIALSQIDANRNSTPILNVTVNGNPIPYEVDVANAKVYVQGRWEGQVVVITGEHVQSAAGNQNNTPFQVQTRLQLIDEITASTDGVSGRAVPMNTRVNEGEAYPILDVYNLGASVGLAGNAVTRGAAAPGFGFVGQQDLYPTLPTDPALQPGRVWLFWTSSRGRTGVFRDGAGQPVSLTGYDIYWQTLAPSFQSPSFSAFPTP